jgi:hypothetical protein
LSAVVCPLSACALPLVGLHADLAWCCLFPCCSMSLACCYLPLAWCELCLQQLLTVHAWSYLLLGCCCLFITGRFLSLTCCYLTLTYCCLSLAYFRLLLPVPCLWLLCPVSAVACL